VRVNPPRSGSSRGPSPFAPTSAEGASALADALDDGLTVRSLVMLTFISHTDILSQLRVATGFHPRFHLVPLAFDVQTRHDLSV